MLVHRTFNQSRWTWIFYVRNDVGWKQIQCNCRIWDGCGYESWDAIFIPDLSSSGIISFGFTGMFIIRVVVRCICYSILNVVKIVRCCCNYTIDKWKTIKNYLLNKKQSCHRDKEKPPQHTNLQLLETSCLSSTIRKRPIITRSNCRATSPRTLLVNMFFRAQKSPSNTEKRNGEQKPINNSESEGSVNRITGSRMIVSITWCSTLSMTTNVDRDGDPDC